MKNSIRILTSLLFVTIISSCGQSEEEKAKLANQQQAREDSIRQSTVDATKHTMENKLALQDSLKNTNSGIEIAKAKLAETKSELEVAKDKMNSVKEAQFLRTHSEREEQIKNQSLVIQGLEEKIIKMQQAINQMESNGALLKSEITKFN